MKIKNLLCLGMTAVLVCSNFSQMAVYADVSYAQEYAAENNIPFSVKTEIKPETSDSGDSETKPEAPDTDGSETHMHSYISEITIEPGCTDEGIKTYTCSECGDAYTEKIPCHSQRQQGETLEKWGGLHRFLPKRDEKCGVLHGSGQIQGQLPGNRQKGIYHKTQRFQDKPADAKEQRIYCEVEKADKPDHRL